MNKSPAYEIFNPLYPEMSLAVQISNGVNDWVAEGKNRHEYVGETKAKAEANRAMYEGK
jgi:hypothetical protein